MKMMIMGCLFFLLSIMVIAGMGPGNETGGRVGGSGERDGASIKRKGRNAGFWIFSSRISGDKVEQIYYN